MSDLLLDDFSLEHPKNSPKSFPLIFFKKGWSSEREQQEETHFTFLDLKMLFQTKQT